MKSSKDIVGSLHRLPPVLVMAFLSVATPAADALRLGGTGWTRITGVVLLAATAVYAVKTVTHVRHYKPNALSTPKLLKIVAYEPTLSVVFVVSAAAALASGSPLWTACVALVFVVGATFLAALADDEVSAINTALRVEPTEHEATAADNQRETLPTVTERFCKSQFGQKFADVLRRTYLDAVARCFDPIPARISPTATAIAFIALLVLLGNGPSAVMIVADRLGGDAPVVANDVGSSPGDPGVSGPDQETKRGGPPTADKATDKSVGTELARSDDSENPPDDESKVAEGNQRENDSSRSRRLPESSSTQANGKKRTHEQICGEEPDGSPAPSLQAKALREAFLRVGQPASGCAGLPTKVEHSGGTWVMTGYCGNQLWSLAVVDANGQARMLLGSHLAKAAKDLAATDLLLRASASIQLRSGWAQILFTSNGPQIASRSRAVATSPAATCEDVKADPAAVAPVVMPPELSSLWLALSATTFTWPVELESDGATHRYKFVSDDGQRKVHATAKCREDRCDMLVDGEPFVARAEVTVEAIGLLSPAPAKRR